MAERWTGGMGGRRGKGEAPAAEEGEEGVALGEEGVMMCRGRRSS